ncbi:MAG: DegV family protein [Gaiellaceae bacterium]
MCTDSSSLLAPAAAARLGVDVVPVAVTLDGEPFDEGANGIDEFYARLRAGAVATTSQPNPSYFAAAYARAASEGAESLVSIHLDARISGTIASAETAAREAPIPVVVVDTRTVSFGVAVCVRTASDAAAVGASAYEVAHAARELGRRIQNVFVARARTGGRLPPDTGWSLMRFADGVASPLAACPTLDAAVAEMAQLVVRNGHGVAAAVGHAGGEAEKAADALAHAILDGNRGSTVERYRVGAPVGAHTGPESLGAFWWSRE